MVLLKDVDSSGLVFYTNTESAKGLRLAANPRQGSEAELTKVYDGQFG